MASGQSCPEAWTFYRKEDPAFDGSPYHSNESYLTHMDVDNVLGLGKDAPMRAAISGAFGLWLLACATTGLAQTNTAEIRGVVQDVSGAVLPSVTVTAVHRASATTVERLTDAEGRFFVLASRVGLWIVTATLPGFSPQTQQFSIAIGQTVQAQFVLKLQGVSEQISVVSPEPLLQTTGSSIR